MKANNRSGNRGKKNSIRNLFVYWFHLIADKTEPVVEAVIWFCGWSAILFVAAIFMFVFTEAVGSLGEGFVSIEGFSFKEFFTSTAWRPDREDKPQYGIFALLVGTGAVTIGSMLLAVPLGLGAAVFISEFCTGRVRETLKIVIELLAAIPSVVWGFIGVVVLGPMIITSTHHLSHVFPFVEPAYVGVNVLNASVILALMSVPVIVSVGEDSLKAVPDSYREAALSLGASRWEIVYRVLFPAAKNGLLAAVLLGVGRAIGETMAVLLCTGHAVNIPTRLTDPARTLTATIASELGEAVRGGGHYRVLFVIGVVLFAITFLVNLIADLVVKGIRGREDV
ncbi:MAG: phosphate ABC transporter permease subunit PstC [Pirellulaceae bacterium]|nr:phosphate ABC transporter permease subunit PstC [Pirellulaceae bacterium]